MSTLVFLLPNYQFESPYVNLAFCFFGLGKWFSWLPQAFGSLEKCPRKDIRLYLVTLDCIQEHEGDQLEIFSASSLIQSLLIFLTAAQQQSIQASLF